MVEMEIRKFNLEKDYENIARLQKEWDLPCTPKTWIPEDSYIIEYKNSIICFGSLYQLGNSAMYWVEGILSNKHAEKHLKKQGLQLLINGLYNRAREQKAEIVMSSTPRESLKNLFNECGFLDTPEKYYHFGRNK